MENQGKITLKETGNILEIKVPKLLELRDEYSRKSGQRSRQTPDSSTETPTSVSASVFESDNSQENKKYGGNSLGRCERGCEA